MVTAINIEEDACNDPADCDNKSGPDFGILVNPGSPERGYAVEDVKQHREQNSKRDKLDSEPSRLLKIGRCGGSLRIENLARIYRVVHTVHRCPLAGCLKRWPAEERHEREGDDAEA